MKLWLQILIPLIVILRDADGQGLYPLHTGNVWQYFQLPSNYGWTSHLIGDTLAANGFTYRIIRRDFGQTDYLGQAGQKVFKYRRKGLMLYEDHLLYDFSKTMGDTLFVEFGQGDTLLCTIIWDGYVEVFGRQRRQQLYYERTKIWTYHVLRQLTDSIGLTDIQFEAGLGYRLTGAMLGGQEFGNITGVDNAETPAACFLLRNFPNPFNPSTTISFSVPEDRHIILKIFNTLGQEIATLVDDVRSAGTYTATFDGSNHSSGVYVCLLTAGNFTASSKLLLIK